MKFWLQAEEISSNVTYKFFANDKELSGADVGGELTPAGCLQAERHKRITLKKKVSQSFRSVSRFFFSTAKQDGP